MVLERYIEKYNIKREVKNYNTEVFEEIVSEKGIDEEMLRLIKNSRLIKDVEFGKITIQDEKGKKEESKENEKGQESNKPKFYF
jgi:hypothetical protein